MGSRSQKDSPVLALGLLVCAAFLYFLGFSETQIHDYDLSSQIDEVENSGDRTVNHHLFLMDQKLQMEAIKMKQQNTFKAPDIRGNSVAPQPQDFLPLGIDHSQDTFETQVIQDLDNSPRKLDNYMSPDSQIQNLVIEEQIKREQELKFKKSIAQQFIENARAGGYDVRLDDNLNVVSVKKLRQPSQVMPNLFQGSGNSAK
ncbi:MAG: hypothetical protein LW875_03040 [Proteobacteria bacterium]|jgi:hypothetical protein|nr:hypothetical protein [Pseudomonadota bacterium]